jgi:hypothetical protein
MSMVYNLGDLALIQFYLLILILVLVILKIARCFTSEVEDYVKNTSNLLMFNWPLRFFMEAYMEICFGSWMKIIRGDMSFNTKTDSMDTVLAWFYFVLSWFIPLVLSIILYFCEKTIKAKGPFFKRIESAFEDVSLKSGSTMNYVTIFLMRRLLLILAIFFCVGNKSVFQGIYNIQACLFYLCYLLHCRPFTSKALHNQEVFTEICYLLFGYNLLVLGAFVPDGETKFFIGWV